MKDQILIPLSWLLVITFVLYTTFFVLGFFTGTFSGMYAYSQNKQCDYNNNYTKINYGHRLGCWLFEKKQ